METHTASRLQARALETGSRVLVAGYYGFGNAGDEAILEAILTDFRTLSPDLQPTVISGDPAGTTQLHGVTACYWKDLAAITAEVERSDLVVIGGGGLFHDYWGFDPETILTSQPDGLSFWCGVSLLATLAAKPLVIHSVGVGPLYSEEAKRHVRMVFEQSVVATVRDPQSREILIELGVDPGSIEVTSDPVCGLAVPEPSRSRGLRSRLTLNQPGPLLVASLRHWDESSLIEQWAPKVGAALDSYLKETGGTVLFVPFQSLKRDHRTDDLGATKRVREAMQRADQAIVVDEPLDHRQLRELIASADLTLGMRLHSLIFALTSGVPAVGLSYDPKVENFMQRAGCSELCLRLDEFETDQLAACLVEAWTKQLEWTQRAQDGLASLVPLAHQATRLAVKAWMESESTKKPSLSADVLEHVKRVALRQTFFRAGAGSSANGSVSVVSAPSPLVSYVVVTYGGLVLTRACLASLLNSETWRRLEVVVVDNASDDGTPDYLRDLAARDDRLQVVCNQENLGFAAATNQGLKRARGDVLILLNNDTVVPPGMTGRLVEHLIHDSSIGLICPTTNFCGNEAKVDPEYSDLADLANYADQRAESHRGKSFNIGVAAMYCVALRRETLEAVGPLDEQFGMGMFEDDDYSHRVREAGRRVVCAEDAYVHHVGQAAFGKLTREQFGSLWKQNRAYYEQKWGRKWIPHKRRSGVSAPASKFRSAGAQVAAAMQYDIVCFSIINWEFRWQRPQQMMSLWARRGHRVFYLRITDFLPSDGEPIAVQPLAHNVWEVRIALRKPFNVYSGHHPEDFVPMGLEALRHLRAGFGIDRAVSVVDLASWTPLACAARETFDWPVAYDCMDDWSTFPGMKNSAAVLAWEEKLAHTADLMVVSSHALKERWDGHRPDVLRVCNAADFEFFKNASGPDPLPDVDGPVAGFFGGIAAWVDLALVAQVARARPGVTFVLVGGVHNVSVEELENLPNVRLEGLQPYEKMPLYLRRFDVCLIPFEVSPTTHGVDPVKFYEYLSQGKPVVSTRFREITRYGDLLYLANDEEDFARQLDLALGEDDPALRARRIQFARENTWGERLDRIEEALVKKCAMQSDNTIGSAPRVSALAIRLASLQSEAGELRAAEQALLAELAACDCVNQELRNSRSWRITSPLRAISGGLKGFLRKIVRP